MIYFNGRKYKGEYKNGKMHGKGEFEVLDKFIIFLVA